MPFYEYPKALYLQGDAEQASVTVNSPEEEAEARAQGYRMIGETEPAPAPAPAPAPPAPSGESGEEDYTPVPPDPVSTEPTVESVRAQLDAQGIEYDGRWGLSRLLSLLPAEGA